MVMKIQIFCGKEILKVDSNQTCLSVIILYPALSKDENCYPQVFLKECKYIKKKGILLKTQKFSIYFDEESSFFFNEQSKKFQKDDKVFLCKLFPYLGCPFTPDYKKFLFTILITGYTAFFSSKLIPFLDYKMSCLQH